MGVTVRLGSGRTRAVAYNQCHADRTYELYVFFSGTDCLSHAAARLVSGLCSYVRRIGSDASNITRPSPVLVAALRRKHTRSSPLRPPPGTHTMSIPSDRSDPPDRSDRRRASSRRSRPYKWSHKLKLTEDETEFIQYLIEKYELDDRKAAVAIDVFNAVLNIVTVEVIRMAVQMHIDAFGSANVDPARTAESSVKAVLGQVMAERGVSFRDGFAGELATYATQRLIALLNPV